MNQHRRDLNTNELEKLVTKATPFLERYGNKLIYGLCAVMIASAVIYYITASASVADSSAWAAFVSSDTAEDFGNVADQYRDNAVGAWARLNEAESYLEQGLRAAFTQADWKSEQSDLLAAKDSFSKLLENPKLPETVHERGLFGLARSLEALSGKDTEEAVKAYEAFLKQFPDSVYAKAAQERVTVLKSPAGQEFYAWFNAAERKERRDLEMPSDGLPPGHPAVDPGSLLELPPIPDMLKLPEDTVQGTAPALPDLPSEGGRPAAPPLPESKTESGSAPPLPTDQ